MPSLLPDGASPRISARAHAPRSADLAQLDALLVIVPESGDAHWHTLPNGAWLRAERERRRCRSGQALSTRIANEPGTHLIVGLRAADATAFQTLTLAGRMVKEALATHPRRIGLMTAGLASSARRRTLEALGAATLAGAFEMPTFKSESVEHDRVSDVTLFGESRRSALAVTSATAEGNNLARWLTALPGNELDAASYCKRIGQLAKREGWRMTFLDSKALRRRGAGAFLAVAQGNATDDAGIVHLEYKPATARARPPVALVGKGICFDTGGTNLKAHKGMLDMHTDMEGSAVALGTLLALTRLEANFPADCWLAITENRIGPKAYKPQDVVKAANGTSIHVIHTDAEGRMVLADALALAAERKPSFMMDFATLTGACVNALTERYSGVFSNRPRWHTEFERAGVASGERVWPFPMDEDFDTELESPLADIMQCTPENKGDHILAARFLNRFVPASVPWLHVDLAASQRTGGLAHITTDITGFGVRFAIELLLEQRIGDRERAPAAKTQPLPKKQPRARGSKPAPAA